MLKSIILFFENNGGTNIKLCSVKISVVKYTEIFEIHSGSYPRYTLRHNILQTIKVIETEAIDNL